MDEKFKYRAKDFMGDNYISLPKTYDRYGFTSVEILSEFVGKPWDDLALAYCTAFNPSYIRVTQGDVNLDSVRGRITVYVDNQNIIEKIEQEVRVWLPDGVVHGEALYHAKIFGIDSDECKWHKDAESYLYSDKYYKFVNGKAIPFPSK